MTGREAWASYLSGHVCWARFVRPDIPVNCNERRQCALEVLATMHIRGVDVGIGLLSRYRNQRCETAYPIKRWDPQTSSNVRAAVKRNMAEEYSVQRHTLKKSSQPSPPPIPFPNGKIGLALDG
jgi:hypothetical protein